MNHSTLNPPVGFTIAARPRRSLRAMLGDWYADIVRRQRHRRAIRELRGLDTRLLRDMGLHRGMIVDVVINGDPRRAAHRRAAPVGPVPATIVAMPDPVEAWARHAAASNGFGG